MTPPGIDPETVRLVAQCLNLYATPGPKMLKTAPKSFKICYTATEIMMPDVIENPTSYTHTHTYTSASFLRTYGPSKMNKVNGFIVIWPKGSSGIQEGGIQL